MNNVTLQSWITTSWDDGHPLDLRVADLLDKYGLAGTFYVPRTAERNVMTASQVRHISRKFEIGAHTLDHKYLDRIPLEDAKEQIIGSRLWIEDLTGLECRSFCFPGGKFRKSHLDLLAQAGFRSARTVELLNVRGPRRMTNLWLIPTTVQVYPHLRFAYARNALKRMAIANLFEARTLLFSADWTAIAGELLRRVIKMGGIFHLWGHSWEIEQTRQWDRLEHLLAVIALEMGKSRCITNAQVEAYAANSCTNQ